MSKLNLLLVAIIATTITIPLLMNSSQSDFIFKNKSSAQKELMIVGYNGTPLKVSVNGRQSELYSGKYRDCGWVEKFQNTLILCGEFAAKIYFVNSNNQEQTFQLNQLKSPVASVTTQQHETYVACYGGNSPNKGGFAVIKGGQVQEHPTPAYLKPKETSPSPGRQGFSYIHFVDQHHGQPVMATDLGYDHLYSLSGNGQFKTIYTFQRGYGPRHFAWDSAGDCYVIGEMMPTLIKLNGDQNNMKEKARLVLEQPNKGWSGGEIHINKRNEIFVTVRDESWQGGYIAKIRCNGNSCSQVQKAVVGHLPRQFSFSEDEQRIIVANQNGKDVKVFDANTLKQIGVTIKTGNMNPVFAMEL